MNFKILLELLEYAQQTNNGYLTKKLCELANLKNHKFANRDDYHEEDVDEKGILKFPQINNDIVWSEIQNNFCEIYDVQHDFVSVFDVFEWMSENYNTPNKK